MIKLPISMRLPLSWSLFSTFINLICKVILLTFSKGCNNNAFFKKNQLCWVVLFADLSQIACVWRKKGTCGKERFWSSATIFRFLSHKQREFYQSLNSCQTSVNNLKGCLFVCFDKPGTQNTYKSTIPALLPQ